MTAMDCRPLRSAQYVHRGFRTCFSHRGVHFCGTESLSLASLFRVVGPRTPPGETTSIAGLRFRQKHGRSPRWGPEGSYSDHLYRLKVDGLSAGPPPPVRVRQAIRQAVHLRHGRPAALRSRTLRILTTASEIDRLTLPAYSLRRQADTSQRSSDHPHLARPGTGSGKIEEVAPYQLLS